MVVLIVSSPVRKYRKSYCNHLSVGVRVAQMLKFLVKVFISLYLLNIMMWIKLILCILVTIGLKVYAVPS